MRLFVSFTLLLFCSIQGFGQKVSTPKKTSGYKKTVRRYPNKINKSTILDQLFGNYIISNYYSLVKKSAKKKEINTFLKTLINLNIESISGLSINDITFSIYEIEKMKKDDYFYRVFNESITIEIPDLPEILTVHKTNFPNFFGIIQLPNGHVAFPYKGGLIIAKPSLAK
jgi:hypothetical protein